MLLHLLNIKMQELQVNFDITSELSCDFLFIPSILGLDFYHQVKIVNYIRRQVCSRYIICIIFLCQPPKNLLLLTERAMLKARAGSGLMREMTREISIQSLVFFYDWTTGTRWKLLQKHLGIFETDVIATNIDRACENKSNTKPISVVATID